MRSNSMQRKAVLRVVDLKVGAYYVTPLGKLCKLMPHADMGPGSSGDNYTFAYLGEDDNLVRGESFTIHARNVSMLREWLA